MRFRAAKQNRIFQDVVEQIQDAILRNDLKPGDTLPSERDLKEMFQTSRGTLREALRVLEQKGLIEIRLGAAGGAVIKAAPGQTITDGLDLLIRSRKISLPHLSEFREGVEGTVAALAAERATLEDVAVLDGLVADAARYAADGLNHWAEFLEVDKQVHQTLARITGNPMYILIHQMVHENIHPYYDDYLAAGRDRLLRNYEDLRDIVTAVREGRSNEAQILAQRHVRQFTRYMTETAGIGNGMAPAPEIAPDTPDAGARVPFSSFHRSYIPDAEDPETENPL